MADSLRIFVFCMLAALPSLAQDTVVVSGDVPGQLVARAIDGWWEYMPAHILDAYGYPGLVATTVVPSQWDRAALNVQLVHFASAAPAGADVRLRLVFYDPVAGEIVAEQEATVDVGETIDEPAFNVLGFDSGSGLEPGGIYTYRLERLSDHADDDWTGSWYLSGLFFEYSVTAAEPTTSTCGRLMSEGRLQP